MVDGPCRYRFVDNMAYFKYSLNLNVKCKIQLGHYELATVLCIWDKYGARNYLAIARMLPVARKDVKGEDYFSAELINLVIENILLW